MQPLNAKISWASADKLAQACQNCAKALRFGYLEAIPDGHE
jgi:hypothetical protein